MDELELELHKLNAMFLQGSIKILNRSINFYKRYLIFTIFMTLFNFYFIISNLINSKSYTTSVIATILWLISDMFNLYFLNVQKKKLKKEVLQYDEEQKIIDYPKYIKDQRLKKLKKI